MIQAMDGLRYKWGDDWLPHDATQHHPTSGTNARKQLIGLGCRVKDIPKSDPEARIKAARMMFPRVYMDNMKRDTPPDRPDRMLGAGNLMERLKRYKRHVPKNTQEPVGPVHDAASHGSDAWGGLAEIVDQIRNGDEMPKPKVAAFRNSDAGMGMLG
jgi:phage terminase large subunit